MFSDLHSSDPLLPQKWVHSEKWLNSCALVPWPSCAVSINTSWHFFGSISTHFWPSGTEGNGCGFLTYGQAPLQFVLPLWVTKWSVQSACLCNLRECNSELINNYQIDLATKETSQGFSGIRAMKWCLFVDFSCICRILCCSRALAQWTWGPEQGKLWLCGALCLLGYEVGDAHSWSRIWVAPSQGSSSKASLWAEWMDLAAV